jgi:hypothetical protein
VEKTFTERCKINCFYLISNALHKITFQVNEYDIDTKNASTVQFFFTSYIVACNTTNITLWIQDCIQISDAIILFLKSEKETI